MAIKVYVSGISGNKEVKKRQQRVLMILDSKNIKYEVVDIAEPGNEEAKEFMQGNSKCLGATIGDANPKYPLPPQLFNDEEYCGDYDQFDLSNEIDEIEKFLKLPYDESVTSTAQVKIGNGVSHAESLTNGNEAEAKEQKDDTSLSDKPEGQEVTSSEDQAKPNDDDNKEKEIEDESETKSDNGAEDKVEEDKNEKEDDVEVNSEKEDDAEVKVEKEDDAEVKVEKEDDSNTKVDAEEKEESDEDSEDKSIVDTKDG